MNDRNRVRVIPYFYVGPVVILLILLTLFPYFYNIYTSLFNFNLLRPRSMSFVGLRNYIRVLAQDKDFWHSFGVTAYFSAVGVCAQVILGTVLALLLSRKTSFVRSIYRTVMMLPIACTPIAVAYMWRIMYAPSSGLINYLLSLIGITGPEWVASIQWAMPSLIIVDTWQWTPFLALIILSGLMSLPQEPFDAATVEGASAVQTFWYITLPLLRPVLLIGVLLRMIDSFKLFDIVYAMTGGGPLRVTETLNYYIYLTAFRYLNIGYGSSLSVVLLLIVLALSLVFVRTGGIKFESR